MLRYSFNFKILYGRNPILRSPSGSRLRYLMDAVKGALDDFTADLNAAYDARLINTASGNDLDEHGETLNLPRNAGESDTDYRNRLLTDLRDIPEGLTVAELKEAYSSVMGVDPDVYEYYKFTWDWPEYDPEVTDPTYQWNKWANDSTTRFVVAMGTTSTPNSAQLDLIETGVLAIKPGHITVHVVKLGMIYLTLLREIK